MTRNNKLVINNNCLWYFYNTIFTYFTVFENQYFLFLGLVQFSTGILLPESWSPTGRYSTLIPLIFCVFVELVSVYQQYFRNKKMENEFNNRIIKTYENGEYINKKCDELEKGDIICCDVNDQVPVDGVLIRPIGSPESTESNVCEISVVLINGENNLKYIKGINKGENVWNYTEKRHPEAFIQNNSIIKTKGAIIFTTAVGNEKKNSNFKNSKTQKKVGILDKYISDCISKVNIKLLVCLMIFVTTIRLINDLNNQTLDFVGIICNTAVILIQSWIMLNSIIPFSVKILLVFMRKIEMLVFNSYNSSTINNSSIVDDFNRIPTIISDKTGTLTKGKLEVIKFIEVINNNIECIETNKLKNNDNNEYSKLCVSVGTCININGDGTFCTDEDKILHEFCNNNNLLINESDSNVEYLHLNNLKFTFNHKRSSVIVKNNDEIKIICKGSIDSIKSISINSTDITNVEKYININSPHCKLIAYATKILDQDELELFASNEDRELLENNLEFIGVVCFNDELRDDVHDLVQLLKYKNIKLNLCSGDRSITCIEMAKQLNLIEELDYVVVQDQQDFTTAKMMVFSGNIVDEYCKHSDFITCLRMGNFIAYNMSPEHKQILANILNYRGNCLAIGDGHNDINMFNESQISVAISDIKTIANHADYVINELTDLTNYLNIYANNYRCKNERLINYTFYRCVMTNICYLMYLLLQVRAVGFDNITNKLFDGFVLMGFNFLWITLPLIKYHKNISFKHCTKINRNEKYKKIYLWIFSGICNAVILISVLYYLFSEFTYVIDLTSLMVIINLNLVYGFLISYTLNWELLFGPMIYIAYALLKALLVNN